MGKKVLICLCYLSHFSVLRSVDLSTPSDQKQFQELLLERTKALAAATQAESKSNSDGKFLFYFLFKINYKKKTNMTAHILIDLLFSTLLLYIIFVIIHFLYMC